jgi:hypothetical protein
MNPRYACRESLIIGLVALLVVALVAGPAVAAAPRADGADGAVPTVTGPVTGGQGVPAIISTTFDPAQFGYLQEEYFLAGDASAYAAQTPLTEDGVWAVVPTSTAPYVTRIVVVRPEDPKDFNGTVFVEWLNVSAGFDTAPGWALSHLEMLREGAAWVGVSAQSVGVQGGQATVGGVAGGGLKGADPARYGTLTHPGDSYSYDIFTQAARAVRGEGAGGVKPLGPLTPKRVIATGESQSATRMVTYVNAIHPLVREYDGFLVHSRFGGAAALSQAPLPDVPAPVPTRVRTDLREPVLTFLTESDVGPLGAAAARQPDTKRLRTWEVAGTAHADVYTTLGFGDTGDGSAEVALLDYTKLSRGALNCGTPINAGPQYAVLMAAVSHLDRWVRDGTPPPKGTPLTVTDGPGRVTGGRTVPNYVVTRDEYGNAVGGIRTPFVDAPRAALTGETNTGGSFCGLFGTTAPFDDATLARRYPSRDAFLAEFRRAAKQAVRAGFLLPEESTKLRNAAAQVPYGASG